MLDSVQLRNIGNGPAFNIRYEAQFEEREGGPKGALPYLAKGETESTYLRNVVDGIAMVIHLTRRNGKRFVEEAI